MGIFVFRNGNDLERVEANNFQDAERKLKQKFGNKRFIFIRQEEPERARDVLKKKGFLTPDQVTKLKW